jgi:hypothetical protein
MLTAEELEALRRLRSLAAARSVAFVKCRSSDLALVIAALDRATADEADQPSEPPAV